MARLPEECGLGQLLMVHSMHNLGQPELCLRFQIQTLVRASECGSLNATFGSELEDQCAKDLRARRLQNNWYEVLCAAYCSRPAL